eukprot:SAG25_NODE_20_length_23237_cov_58.179229_7_plen_129_part_00
MPVAAAAGTAVRSRSRGAAAIPGRPIMKFTPRAHSGEWTDGWWVVAARPANPRLGLPGLRHGMPKKGSTISCTVCEAPGVTGDSLRHTIVRCPNRPADYVAPPTRFRRCGEPGHNVRRCPRPPGYVRP